MATRIESMTMSNLAPQDPVNLKELLAAGKKLPPDAIALLMQDHAEVKAKFLQYQSEKSKQIKAVLATKICAALTVHAQIEEAIFYPEAERAIEDDDQIDEAVKEHAQMKEQIAKVMEGMGAGKSTDSGIKKLMQLVEHHVQEEESEMFPDMRETETDLYSLGGQLAARRAEALISLKRSIEELEARL